MKVFVKILISLFWAALIGSLIFLMGFINDKNGELTLRSIEITIDRQDQIFLLSEEDVMDLIGNKNGELMGRHFSEIVLESIEHKIRGNAYVMDANVYSTLPGNLYIDIVQRIPLVRIVNERYEHYYVSMDGRLMPLHPEVIILTLLANGMIPDTLNPRTTLRKLNGIQVGDNLHASSLETIYNLARHIHSDDFLKAQVEQMYVNEQQEVEMIPKVGDHVIIFGSLENMESKFKKLTAFYMQGVKYSGWDKYSVIDLKFKNQIVCTK